MSRTSRLFLRPWLLALPLLAEGCAGREKPAPIALAPAPAPVVALAALPDGATPGMLVPTALPDGSYPTPNQRLSAAGTMWHLRTGLNVAALSCQGAEGATIRAGYNGWLTRRKAALATVAASYAAEYRTGEAAYDEAMTRLYNFWSQTPVRPSFCAAAARIIADWSSADPDGSPAIAAADLGALDRPFVDFYRAYDAWRRGTMGQPVIAAAAVMPAGPAAPTPRHRPGSLVLDLSSLPVDAEVAGGR